jgi:HEPN domain-containing protein
MNEELANRYIVKAENDLKTAKDEIITGNPATDTVCFHAQQCTEKYLKAYLAFNGVNIDKPLRTHNIDDVLLVACKEKDDSFNYLIGIRRQRLIGLIMGYNK